MITVLINTHMLMAARESGARRFFYSSSACVYAGFKQQRPDIPGLKEDDAYPADPEDGYGWEKLFSERMCRHFREDFRLETRVARYHNVYGPRRCLQWRPREGSRSNLPKVIAAKLSGHHEIEIWATVNRRAASCSLMTAFARDTSFHGKRHCRSHQHRKLRDGDNKPARGSRGRNRRNQGRRNYKLDAPKGVRGRSSDNALIKSKLGWEP